MKKNKFAVCPIFTVKFNEAIDILHKEAKSPESAFAVFSLSVMQIFREFAKNNNRTIRQFLNDLATVEEDMQKKRFNMKNIKVYKSLSPYR